MNKARIVNSIVWLNAIAISLFIVWYSNLLFPLVGQDFKYTVPRLIDTYLHYKINGLSIQWYTPSFGGGLPAYPNPQHIQFSLLQFLTTFLNPWSAILVTTFLMAMAGFLGTYYFIKSILQFHPAAAILGAVIFAGNGYFIEHSVAGHVFHMGFSLLPCFLVALLETRLPAPVRGALISLLSGILIYSGGFYPAVFIMLSMLVCLPLVYIFKPDLFRWRELMITILIGSVLTIGLNGSKLWAINSFLRFFPRIAIDVFNVPFRTAIPGLLLQLAGTMSLAPIYWLLGLKLTLVRNLLQAYTGAYSGYWELDLSVSPIAWILLFIGIIGGFTALARRKIRLPAKDKLIAGALFLLAIEIVVEFTLARGWIYPHLQNLPILRSLHVNPRFGSAFILPIALACAWIFHFFTKNISDKKSWLAFSILNGLALISLGAFVIIPIDVLQRRGFNMQGPIEVYESICNENQLYPITQIVTDLNDPRVFQEDASNLKTYEVIFGYNMEDFKPLLHDGPITDLTDGAYNMTDPTGYVYPEENGTTAFERIKDSAALELFANRRQPPQWKISITQRILDWLALLTLLTDAGIIGWHVFKRK